ncbi:MAG: phosphoglycerate kinase [Alphaproteobacteria bacterium 16-39-46]|nr:MAG: phosphoglycerate kinase [Alphaproteobacteria bacterium 16-39-46]OZA42949.1 MAG: phosphoglycerate kinase [Alphaproteobacteria bacterium 17-39-52]HQS84198.1 phosphoglycerate kinase [Alphaproteobacteria bacterium]HQS94046.1 phosphoglycerate kinase [Alphaproteobacteria bacterium]
MEKFLTLDDLDVSGKRVLVRCDFNVPFHNNKILDSTRIDRAAPTLLELMDRGAKIIILSHLGRPHDKNPLLSLKVVQEALSDTLYGTCIHFISDCIGPDVEKAVQNLENGQVLLLENLRFHIEEEQNDPLFADQLAKLGDIYINDAFSTSHRAHASVEALPHRMPIVAIGRLMQAELEALSFVLESPKRPVMGIVGGSKVSTKLQLLRNLIPKLNKLVLGGGMANTLLYAQGFSIGKSLYEESMKDIALDIISFAKERNCELLLPSDVIITPEIKENSPFERTTIENIPENSYIVDIGPTTRRSIIAHLKDCHTVLWNGPLGVFEIPPFDEGSHDIALEVAKRSRDKDLISIAGGGDTVAVLSKMGVLNDFTYVSTGGGAFLEWLEGHTLPGIKCLERTLPEGLHCPLK